MLVPSVTPTSSPETLFPSEGAGQFSHPFWKTDRPPRRETAKPIDDRAKRDRLVPPVRAGDESRKRARGAVSPGTLPACRKTERRKKKRPGEARPLGAAGPRRRPRARSMTGSLLTGVDLAGSVAAAGR